jgi:hypothetical protein
MTPVTGSISYLFRDPFGISTITVTESGSTPGVYLRAPSL